MRYYSNSEFQCFKECRRKWWLGWHRRLIPRRPSLTGAAPLGTRVHLALAGLYVPESEGPQDPREVLEQVIAQDRARIMEAYIDDPQAGAEILSDMEKENEYARAMIEGYVAWLEQTGADSEFEVLGSEQLVKYEVSEGRTLIGRLDARVRRIIDGIRFFIDHKTCQSFVDLQRSLKQTEQMPTYLLLERASAAQEDGEYVHGAIFNGLRKVKRTATAKPPFYDRFEKTYNDHELTSMWYRIQGTMHEIESVEQRLEGGMMPLLVVPPTPTRDCHWKCEFYAVCPMFDDGSRVEDMLSTHYEVGDPLSRYPELTGGVSADSE